MLELNETTISPGKLKIMRSWLLVAEKRTNSCDKFGDCWKALEALDNKPKSVGAGNREDRKKLCEILQELVMLDSDDKIYNALWTLYRSGRIEQLLYSPVLFSRQQKHAPNAKNRKFRNNNLKREFNRALERKDMKKNLRMIFVCLKRLRNKIEHGDIEQGDPKYRGVISASAGILFSLLPLFEEIIRSHIDHEAEKIGARTEAA